MNFSASEVLVISSIVVLMALECISSARSKTWVEVYKPTLFVTIILAFYALVGPLRAIFSSGATIFFAMNFEFSVILNAAPASSH